MANKIYTFFRLIRYEDQATSIQFILGYLLFKGFAFSFSDLILVLELFIILGPLLYGGIYIFNDIVDLKYDRRHPIKKTRMLAAKKISLGGAFALSATLILLALILSYLFFPGFLFILLSFLAINIAYTLFLKHIPYVEIVFNSITHTFRIISGMFVAGGLVFGHFLLVHFIVVLATSTFKRYRELDTANAHSRAVLRFYTKSTLNVLQHSLLGIAVIVLLLSWGSFDFYLGLIPVTLGILTLVGYKGNKTIRKLLDFCFR